VRHLQRAVELSPTLPSHQVELGFALLADGQRDAARATFERALALPIREKYDSEARARATAALQKLR
jgi:Flp pilus assembly protein TadD